MTNQWLLNVIPRAEKQVARLPARTAAAVFATISELLLMDNPLAHHDAKKVKNREGIWRKRVGDQRILFYLTTELIVVGDVRYKGTLVVVDVVKRDEHTYD